MENYYNEGETFIEPEEKDTVTCDLCLCDAESLEYFKHTDEFLCDDCFKERENQLRIEEPITLEKLERAIELFKFKEYALRRRDFKLDSINGFGGINFPELNKKWQHDADISQMAADRIDNYLRNYLKSLVL